MYWVNTYNVLVASFSGAHFDSTKCLLRKSVRKHLKKPTYNESYSTNFTVRNVECLFFLCPSSVFARNTHIIRETQTHTVHASIYYSLLFVFCRFVFLFSDWSQSPCSAPALRETSLHGGSEKERERKRRKRVRDKWRRNEKGIIVRIRVWRPFWRLYAYAC